MKHKFEVGQLAEVVRHGGTHAGERGKVLSVETSPSGRIDWVTLDIKTNLLPIIFEDTYLIFIDTDADARIIEKWLS